MGVAKDIDQAKVWYQKASDQGNGFASVRLQRLQPNAPPTAMAAPNTPSAQYELGQRYFYGTGGKVNGRQYGQDYRLAVYSYRKAADQGDADAQFMLGWCYENGLGVERDYDQAQAWYQKAADQGHQFAMVGLKRLEGK